MRKISRKLLMGVLTTFVAMIALGTVTFAWFTLTNTATVSDINVDVKTIGGIELSLGETAEWFTEVSSYFGHGVMGDYMENLGYTNKTGFGLQHITSKDGENFTDRAGNPLTNSGEDGYVEMTINLRSLVANQKIYLTPNTTLESPLIDWIADANFKDSHDKDIVAGQRYPYYVANAARMSFDGNGTTFIYELPEGLNGNKYQSDVVQQEGSVSYYERKHNLAAGTLLSTYEPEIAETNESFLYAAPIATLPSTVDENGYYSTSIIVRLWLEGWDADCIDAILTSKLTASLEFTTIQPTGYREEIYLEDVEGTYVLEALPKEYFVEVGENVSMQAVNRAHYARVDSLLAGTVQADVALVLYQKFERNTYTITFEDEEGATIDDITEKWGVNISSPTRPDKEGYTYLWSVESDLSVEYIFDEMPDKDLHLYGGYVINEYTISFESNGGSDVDDIAQDFDTDVTAPDEPTKTGHTFKGWFTEETFDNEFTFDKMPAEDVVLYAKWELNQYTISFDTDGGNVVAPITMFYDATIGELEVPTKAGSTFAGWYEEATFDNEFTLTKMPDKDFTLYAKWE